MALCRITMMCAATLLVSLVRCQHVYPSILPTTGPARTCAYEGEYHSPAMFDTNSGDEVIVSNVASSTREPSATTVKFVFAAYSGGTGQVVSAGIMKTVDAAVTFVYDYMSASTKMTFNSSTVRLPVFEPSSDDKGFGYMQGRMFKGLPMAGLDLKCGPLVASDPPEYGSASGPAYTDVRFGSAVVSIGHGNLAGLRRYDYFIVDRENHCIRAEPVVPVSSSGPSSSDVGPPFASLMSISGTCGERGNSAGFLSRPRGLHMNSTHIAFIDDTGLNVATVQTPHTTRTIVSYNFGAFDPVGMIRWVVWMYDDMYLVATTCSVYVVDPVNDEGLMEETLTHSECGIRNIRSATAWGNGGTGAAYQVFYYSYYRVHVQTYWAKRDKTSCPTVPVPGVTPQPTTGVTTQAAAVTDAPLEITIAPATTAQPTPQPGAPGTPSEQEDSSATATIIIAVVICGGILIVAMAVVVVKRLNVKQRDAANNGNGSRRASDGDSSVPRPGGAYLAAEELTDISIVTGEQSAGHQRGPSKGQATTSPQGTATWSSLDNTRSAGGVGESPQRTPKAGTTQRSNGEVGTATANLDPLRGSSEYSDPETRRKVSDGSLATLQTADLPFTDASSLGSSANRGLRQLIQEGDYSYVKLLGRGAFGSVYSCVLGDGSMLAVKEHNFPHADGDIGPHSGGIEKLLSDMQREIQLVSSVQHPNIVHYHGTRLEWTERRLLLFMELASGGTLQSLARSFDESTGPPETVARSYLRQVLEGLAFLHSNGIVHRDLKSANVLLTESGVCKIGDFGTSRVMMNTTGGATKAARTMIGTPHFMAPEMLWEANNVSEDGAAVGAGVGYTKKADIWSFGIMCLEFMNHGNSPWPQFSNTGAALLYIAGPRGTPKYPSYLSDSMRDFIECCCKRQPKDRSSATTLLRHPWLNDDPTGTPTQAAV